mmetsp:Transcript_28658/g.61482  ORF Transcript_28658/g.61482 Transcript_28658/m.61482 type:complete len:367 (+) Transcript_28658:292-1392(+)|eukprot:CAMPEP_0201116444 /NCGR_PEP_ID=MMETSP0850-20130426/724_1 /ASSEMBLY_ACC=CAM_ASM_000622 /TAXON_ID=183588 /ORGANISM="Pseudo-nitzschia fraudulenta, Strain WWA7" /LENGTH=366 /DNA_ID=CAMNT_0047380519 /DNA_START=238 /DNA_END=1338 /DNA_ORIENTATION=+
MLGRSTILSLTAWILALFVSHTNVSSFSSPKAASASSLFRETRRRTNPKSNTTPPTWFKTRTQTRDDNKCGSSTAIRGGSSEDGGAIVAETPFSATPLEAYYLVWSPGFLRRLAFAATILAASRRSGWDTLLAQNFLPIIGRTAATTPAPGVLSNIVLPLLSSSCCAIQLAVNAVSAFVLGAGAGCVGFNSVLGPVRPYLLAFMVAYHTALSSTSGSAMIAFRYAVAFMPEFVFWWNDILRLRWSRKRAVTGGPNENSTESSSSSSPVTATLIVEVPTMGCVACVNKVESTLRQCSPENIDGAASWLNPSAPSEGKKKGGRAKIEVRASSRDELDELAISVVGAIEDAGFKGSKVEQLNVHPATNE